MSDARPVRREGAVSFESRIAAVALLTAVAVLVAASAAFIIEQWRAERVVNTPHLHRRRQYAGRRFRG